MENQIKHVQTLVRRQLNELTPKFWTEEELHDIILQGIRDLWKDIVNLKQEHFLKLDDHNVVLKSGEHKLSGVPKDVHKIYLIEPRDPSLNGGNNGVVFEFKDRNHNTFKAAQALDSVDPSMVTIYFCPTGAGGPDGETVIYCAPSVTSDLNILFGYIPTLVDLQPTDPIPIPGESSNALVAWTLAYARAKERDDRGPDPTWLQVYMTEKTHILEALGVRQYQDPQYADALFEEYWG